MRYIIVLVVFMFAVLTTNCANEDFSFTPDYLPADEEQMETEQIEEYELEELPSEQNADFESEQEAKKDTEIDNAPNQQTNGVCSGFIKCLNSCNEGDSDCFYRCFYQTTTECRVCYNRYTKCLYENGCVDSQGGVDVNCLNQNCYDVYDVCFVGNTQPECEDSDNDGYGLFCENGLDCNDSDESVHPEAQEVCNGKDDDCDLEVDEKQQTCSVLYKWSVLVYMAGDNNLTNSALDDLLSFVSAGGTGGDVAVAVEVELSAQHASFAEAVPPDIFERTWRIVLPAHDAPSINEVFANATSVGDADITSPQELTNFLNWAAERVPAENYLLVIWDHGGGWTGALVDDGSNDFMSMPRIRTGIENAVIKPTVIGFSACLMGMLEVLAELDGLTDYVVASEEVSYGMPIAPVIAALHGHANEMQPVDVAFALYDSTIATMSRWDVNYTIAVFDMSKTSQLVAAVQNLGSLMSQHIDTIKPHLTETLTQVQHMAFDAHKDLADFAIKMRPTGIDELDSQLELVEDLATSQDFLLAFTAQTAHRPPRWNESLADAHGLAVYLPEPVQTYEEKLNAYQNLRFCTEDGGDGWDEFLLNWLDGEQLGTAPGNFSFELSWNDAEVDLDLYVIEARGGLFAAYMGETTPNAQFSQDSLESGSPQEFYSAYDEVDAGNYFVIVKYESNGNLNSPQVVAQLSFVDEYWEDNNKTYERRMSMSNPCSLREGWLNADVVAGRCSNIWFVGKLIRDDKKHTLLPGLYSDIGRRPWWIEHAPLPPIK